MISLLSLNHLGNGANANKIDLTLLFSLHYLILQDNGLDIGEDCLYCEPNISNADRKRSLTMRWF